MNSKAHIIEIDHIVLSEVNLQHAGRLSALIEAEVLQALGGSDLSGSTRVGASETRVAGEVARTAVQAIQGGTHGV